MVVGTPLKGGDSLSLLFVGTEVVRNDLLLWFKGEPTVKALTGAEVAKVIQTKDADGFICERSLISRTRYGHELATVDPSPMLFQGLLDLEIEGGETFEHYLTHSISKKKRNNVRRAMKRPFTMRVSTSAKDLGYFYSQLLVPSTYTLHGERSYLPSLKDFQSSLPKGLMLICEWNGEPVVINYLLVKGKEKRARLWRQGVAQWVLADPKLRTEATTFIDAHTIEYCLAHGYRSISFGKSACLRVNGGYWNKLSWGCEPKIDNYYPFCYLYTVTPTMSKVCQELGFVDLASIGQKNTSAAG